MPSHAALAEAFWTCTGLVAYTYLGYPLLIALRARLRARAIGPPPLPYAGTFSLVICAHNEAARIQSRIQELVQLTTASKRVGEVILVCDGSSDGTAMIARLASGNAVRIIELDAQVGKARALSLGCAQARGDILVFADVRQRWDRCALDCLLDNFSQVALGAVSGELVLQSGTGSLGGIGLYWRYEKWIRQSEASVHSTIGVSGSICAVRRSLFRPIPPGLVLDDLYWPMQVVLRGSRVGYDPEALAFDELPPRPSDELRRKIRTLSGNFQLVRALPAVLAPGLNPVWWQFWSHKVLRLLVPWSLVVMLVTSATAGVPSLYLLFWMQLGFYALAMLGLLGMARYTSRLGALASSFLLLNAAAWIAFWVWLGGRTGQTWHKTSYSTSNSNSVSSAPIHIAYVIDTFMIGGTELNALRTLEALDRKRFDVTLFHCAKEGPLRARFEALGVRMVPLRIAGFRSPRTWLAGLRFGLLLRRMQVDLVHTHDVYTNIFAGPWARMLGGCAVIASRRWFFDVPRAALTPLNRLSYWFAHRVLANSGSVARLLVAQEHIPPEKVVEIPNFLSAGAFEHVAVAQRLQQRRQWQVPDNAFAIGIVARLAAVKNHAMLLRALDRLADDSHLIVIGEGPEQEKLQTMARELALAGRVHFVGAIVSPVNLHQFFDVSILCSRSEGFPNSVIEALAAACPVIATRVGGVIDVVLDGSTGLLVENDNVESLTVALRRLKCDLALRQRIGAAGRQQVRGKYAQEVVLTSLQDLYVQCVDRFVRHIGRIQSET